MFGFIRRALALRRRQRAESEERLRSAITRARIMAIRDRSAALSRQAEEHRRYEPGAIIRVESFDTGIPVAVLESLTPAVRAPMFEGGGGLSGGAGASASWEPAVADSCVASDASPSCDASPSSSE